MNETYQVEDAADERAPRETPPQKSGVAADNFDAWFEVDIVLRRNPEMHWRVACQRAGVSCQDYVVSREAFTGSSAEAFRFNESGRLFGKSPERQGKTGPRKLNDDQVREIRRRRAAGESSATLGYKFGVTPQTIRGIVRGSIARDVT